MEFNFSEEQTMLRDMVRKFTDNEVKPVAQRIDKEHNVDLVKGIFKKGAELGLCGIPFPEQYGGAGFGELGYCILLEELSRGCASTCVTFGAHIGLAGTSILLGGTEEQKQKYLIPLAQGEKMGAYALTEPGAGSDAANIQLSAKRDGDHYILNGTKLWITNGDIADIVVVYAVTDPALKARGGSPLLLSKQPRPVSPPTGFKTRWACAARRPPSWFFRMSVSRRRTFWAKSEKASSSRCRRWMNRGSRSPPAASGRQKK
ncbi:MAG: acyl-CoA dehydrogenase family protein [Candidatus Manganitrophus sp.]|nr:acyl-CoA dehydrogenase family protein [Candidatus Manganitrophus sp.]WDT71950.1 MAG: acyl-CoA dehydrogenase family protein [Candidatus Manganitrophus sp.]WDT75816.1 MAG: acyl-CoA dehydrogenase family protein [Candidatus Manganitrophus sp.]